MRGASDAKMVALTGLSSLVLLVGALSTPHPALGSAADAGTVVSALPSTLRWNLPVIRVVIVRDSNWTPELQKRAIAGFHEWKPFVGKEGIPGFVVLSSPTAVGDVNVRFVPKGTLGGNSVGLTKWKHGDGEIGSVSMFLSFRTTRRDASRQRSTAAHELGHALGITYHSPETGDLMYCSSMGKAVGSADVERLRMSYAH